MAKASKGVVDFLSPVKGIQDAGDKLEAGESLTIEDALYVGLDVAAFVPGGGVITKGGKGAAKTFFKGAKYSDKVILQMNKVDDIYHAFPKSVDGYATKFGRSGVKTGADGKLFQWLEMPGSYGSKTGMFEYIKDANGVINHRYFRTIP